MSSYNKKHDDNFDNNRSESPHSNESLLSLDNTLLCNIESDSDVHISTTFSEECSGSIAKVCKKNIKTNEITVSEITQGISSDLNVWQDKSLMNQVFAQFDSQNEKENTPDKCEDIINLDIFNTFYKEDLTPKPVNVCLPENTAKTSLGKPDINNVHKIKLNSSSCLHITNFGDDTMREDSFVCLSKENDKDISPNENDKNKSPVIQSKFKSLSKCNLPRKKLCLNDITLISEETKDTNPREYSMFYGLSNIVKKLIQEVKGISKLYRMFF